jgi:hypothetical protein
MGFKTGVPKYPCNTCKESCKPNSKICELKVPIIEQCIEPLKIRGLSGTLQRLGMGLSVRKNGDWNIVPEAVLKG